MTHSRFLNILTHLYNDCNLSDEDKCKVLIYMVGGINIRNVDRSKYRPFKSLIEKTIEYNDREYRGRNYVENDKNRIELNVYAKNYIKSFDEKEADTINKLIEMEHFIPQN